jgi:hypothetical protein
MTDRGSVGQASNPQAYMVGQATNVLAAAAEECMSRLKAQMPASSPPIILGNIRPSDDYCHKAGQEENYNESVYYNFFDREKALGGFVRCENRANEGHAEMTICLYQPDGSVLFIYKRPKISTNNGWCAGGFRVDTKAGLVKNDTTYEEKVMLLKDPMQMLDPKSVYAGGKTPLVQIKLAVEHKACGPTWGYSADNYWDSLPPEKREQAKAKNKDNFARNHYELFSHISGTLTVGDTLINLSGNGLRDLWSFGDDLGFTVSTADTGSAGAIQIGRDRYQCALCHKGENLGSAQS